MGFNQKFGKVTEVINIDDPSLGDGGDSFKQAYDEVFKVINSCYDSTRLDAISPLVHNLIAMDDEQTKKFYDEIVKRSTSSDNDVEEFNKLNQQLSGKINKKEAVLEYIKAGTTTLTFANTLLTIAKTILGFVG